jgi:hypothetical protein
MRSPTIRWIHTHTRPPHNALYATLIERPYNNSVVSYFDNSLRQVGIRESKKRSGLMSQLLLWKHDADVEIWTH